MASSILGGWWRAFRLFWRAIHATGAEERRAAARTRPPGQSKTPRVEAGVPARLFPRALTQKRRANLLLPGPACRPGHQGSRRDPAPLRALRLLSRHLSDLSGARQRARFAARPHLPDQG